MNPERIVSALREAVLTMSAALVTMACAMAIDPEPGPVTLAIVLAYALSRSHLDHDLRGRLEAAVILPIVSLGALAVGMLLLHVPWIGAIVFVAGMGLSIWLRRFGPATRRAGSLVGMPFIVILITPYIPSTHYGPLMAALIPVIVALLALVWVALFHALGRKIRWLSPVVRSEPSVIAKVSPASSLRPDASTRMAVQMMVALATAFVIGYVFFAERWAWVVLTAYIVNAGNQGRLDVAYKSVLRVLGAMFGTVLALTVTAHLGAHDTSTVMMILLAVFLGMWLRPISYAWWALFVTVALALLQGFEGQSPEHILVLRMQEIVIGAILGVVSAWLVFPVRSRQVLRRRMADALAALAEACDPATVAASSVTFKAAMGQVESVAPAFRALRRVSKRASQPQPADWIDVMLEIRDLSIPLIAGSASPLHVRQAIGRARKSLRSPEQIQHALIDLRDALGVDTSTRQPAAIESVPIT